MQSVVKLSEASNIYKLSDLANGDQDSSTDHSGDISKKPATTLPSNKEPVAFGNSKSLEASGVKKDAADEPAAPAPSSADDALAWLKIIQSATADLTADVRDKKGEDLARSLAEDAAPFVRNPSVSSASFAGNVRRNPGFHDGNRHEDYGDERELAQKLSYRYAQPRSAPPQTLGAAVMPYVAATGVFAFLAGSAAVYFLMGSSSSDVKARAVAPAAETQVEAPLTHPDQASPKKGSIQRGASPAALADGASFWGSKPEAQGAKGGAAAPAERQPETWSDTVQTFKQFVRPEQK